MKNEKMKSPFGDFHPQMKNEKMKSSFEEFHSQVKNEKMKPPFGDPILQMKNEKMKSPFGDSIPQMKNEKMKSPLSETSIPKWRMKRWNEKWKDEISKFRRLPFPNEEWKDENLILGDFQLRVKGEKMKLIFEHLHFSKKHESDEIAFWKGLHMKPKWNDENSHGATRQQRQSEKMKSLHRETSR